MTEAGLLWVFAGVALIETYFFLLQRLPRELGVQKSIDPRTARLMLPNWYILVWPTIAAKWVLALFIWQEFGVMTALLCLGGAFLFSSVVPMPRRHVARVCERTLERRTASFVDPEGAAGSALVLRHLRDYMREVGLKA